VFFTSSPLLLLTDIKDGTNTLYQNVSNKLSYTVHTAHKTEELNDTVLKA
jgi:hypothetical protein